MESLFSTLPTELLIIISFYSTHSSINELIKLIPVLSNTNNLTSIIYEKYPKYAKDVLKILDTSELDLKIAFQVFFNDKDIDSEVDTLFELDSLKWPDQDKVMDTIIDMIRIKYEFPHFYKIVVNDNIVYQSYNHNSPKYKLNRTFNTLMIMKSTYKDDLFVRYLQTGEIMIDVKFITVMLMDIDHPKIVFDVVNNPNFDISKLEPGISLRTLISIIRDILIRDQDLFNRYIDKLERECFHMVKYFTKY